jgi:hypothetical protein
MKKLLCALIVLLLLAGCARSAALSPAEQALVGKWAYDHDPKTAVLVLKQDGSAKYDGTKYDRFAYNGELLELTGSDGSSLQIRCIQDEDGLLVYRSTVYERDGSGDGLPGVWHDSADNWTFEFTNTGAFMEDGYFPGTYTVDEAAGSFRLHYAGGQLDDTVCYFTLDVDTLTVEYPWRMVPAQ